MGELCTSRTLNCGGGGGGGGGCVWWIMGGEWSLHGCCDCSGMRVVAEGKPGHICRLVKEDTYQLFEIYTTIEK